MARPSPSRPPAPGAARPAGTARPVREGLALLVIVVGVVITAVDTTIVILALPEIQRSLRVGLTSVIWVVIGYLLVITVLGVQVGRIGDMFGRVRMYEAGFVVFILGSLACGLAWNEWSIIVFRLVQGVGGALVASNSGAVIADTFPPERRGRAYGFNAAGWSVGAVLGVVLGGIIVSYVSWRWIFLINVPIGGAAFLVAVRVLVDRAQRQRRRIDWAGAVALGAGLFGVLYAITELASAALDGAVLASLVAGAALLAGFAVVERVQAEPMLDLALFRVPTMTPALLASLFQALANFAVLFLVIMYLQGVRGMRPLDASLLLVPGYVLGAFVGPMAGRLADRRGPVLPATVGLATEAVALALYAQLQVHTALWLVVAASVVNAVGAGAFFPANNAAVMKVAPAGGYGISSGMLRTFGNIGQVFSFSVAILIASRTVSRGQAFAIFVGTTTLHAGLARAFSAGIHAAFYTSMAFMVLAALLSASRGRRGRRRPPDHGPSAALVAGGEERVEIAT